MNSNRDSQKIALAPRSRQGGALTIFTAILVLILMTLMLFYATRVGLFEQRVSSNDLRQKLAFHTAEAGMDYALEFLLANATRISSKSTEASPYEDEDGDLAYHPGWFSDGNTRWTACPADPGLDHPCGGEIAAGGTGSLYYDDPDTEGFDSLPVDADVLGNLSPGTEVRMTAVICPRTLLSTTCLGIDGVPEPGDLETDAKFVFWVLAYGYSDCNDDDGDGAVEIPGECRGRANVARPLGTVENFNGSPSVPFVSKNAVKGQGTFEVVANPNGGGVGVPLSTWINNNIGDDSCPPMAPGGDTEAADGYLFQGDFTSCELQEWYEVDALPADSLCPAQSDTTGCSCDRNKGEAMTYSDPPDDPVIGIDIMKDDAFPCDLFEFYFGYPSSQYQAVKANAEVIDDCGILDEYSEGFFWFSGDTCTISGNIGTINNPIILVSAADSLTSFTGSSDFFGILYVADVEDTDGDAEFHPGGSSAVYGAMVVDVPFPSSATGSNFKVIYSEAGVTSAGGGGGLGGVAGGWRDFGLPQITWEQ